MWLLHFDGLCEPKNPGGVAAYGFQVLHEGRVAHEGHGLASPPSPDSTNNVAEYTALIQGMTWLLAHERRGEPVRIRGDSKLVIEQVNGKWKVNSPRLKSLHAQAVALVKELKPVAVEWVPRDLNGEADRLSRLGFAEAVAAHPEWKLDAHRDARPGPGTAKPKPPTGGRTSAAPAGASRPPLSGRRATQKQLDYLKSLRVEHAPDITVEEASRLIDAALARRDGR